MSDPVDAVIARVQTTYRGWRRDTPVARMRADWDALFGAPADAATEDVDADGVPCRWFDAPGARDDRVVVYFHGGGFQVGSLDSHAELMGALSAAAQARVLGVGYRLAPEHRHPAALDDALAVMAWLRRRGDEDSLGKVEGRGASTPRIALAGDSAGGQLALATLLRLHAQGDALPVAAYLMSAWTDLTASGASYETRAATDPIHQRPMIRAMARNYLGGDGADGAAAQTVNPEDPRVSPLFADPASLRALPPLLLQVGDRETVLSDSEDFARKVVKAGGQAECQAWPGMIHVFQQFLRELPQSREALAAGGRFLATHLDRRTPR